MLKLPEMPNPFKLAFSSYRMTDFGKLFFGSFVADAAAEAYDNHQAQQRQQYQQNLTPEQEAWEFYRAILGAIARSNNNHWWQNQSRCIKKKYLVALCMSENRAYLVPAMEACVFPYL